MDTDLIDRWSAMGAVEWGVNDCAACCANQLFRWSGHDPAKDWRVDDGFLAWGKTAGPEVVKRMLRATTQPGFQRVKPVNAPPMALGLGHIGNWTFGLALGKGWWIWRAEPGATVTTTEAVRYAWIWRPT